jgi:hypothetical protein
MGRPRIDHSGKKFGQLVLVDYVRAHPRGRGAVWRASCDCGRTTEVVASDVVSGRVRTCGNCRTRLGILAGEVVATDGISRGWRRKFRRAVREWRSVDSGVEFPTRDWIAMRGAKCSLCGHESSENAPCVVRMPSGSPQLTPMCGICTEQTARDRASALEWLGRVLQWLRQNEPR